MILLLNDSLWHPLPDRADERFVQEAFARFKIDAPTEPLFADDDSDDEMRTLCDTAAARLPRRAARWARRAEWL
jgi:hypothetical protein